MCTFFFICGLSAIRPRGAVGPCSVCTYLKRYVHIEGGRRAVYMKQANVKSMPAQSF